MASVAARVVVVGLGPGGADLVTAGTLAAIDAVPHRYLRTARHPAVSAVPGAASFDRLYEEGATFDEVYASIVEALVAAAVEHGEVLYAVPGSPRVAERSVDLLAADGRVEVEVLPALSFADLAWVRLGVDPVAAGVRIVDGRDFDVSGAGERAPLLVCQCDDRLVLGDVKLAVEEFPQAPVVVLQRLGLPDEAVYEVPWEEIDRIDADHLTALYIPELVAPVAAELQRFVELVAALRVGCPWDREQTHQSLKRHLLEETYEVLEAIDGVDLDTGAGYGDLEEELGDLLFQVVFHSAIAAETGEFTLADVARGIHDKLHGRHPHVFGDASFEGVDDLRRHWEQQKKHDKGRDSVMDGIPVALPALAYAAKVLKKAGAVDLDLDVATPSAALAVLAADGVPDADQIGAALLSVVAAARAADVDPEDALRTAATHQANKVRAQGH